MAIISLMDPQCSPNFYCLTKLLSNSVEELFILSFQKTKNKKNVFTVETHLGKDIKSNRTSDTMVEKSDEDIIKTIVELLEAEKRKRDHNKKREKFGHLSKNKSLERPSPANLRNRRHSKKVKLSGKESENLMQEEEEYKEHRKGS